MAYFKKLVLFTLVFGLVSAGSSEESSNESSENSDSTNSTNPQDLYVIKTVVYEVGILTNATDDSDIPLNETHEQVDVSFFDPKHNGSVIDLSKIPLPIQTNISGVSVTGVLPANLGQIIVPQNSSEGLTLNESFPVLPDKEIKVTQNISTDNPDTGSEIISNLPTLLGLNKSTHNTTDN